MSARADARKATTVAMTVIVWSDAQTQRGLRFLRSIKLGALIDAVPY